MFKHHTTRLRATESVNTHGKREVSAFYKTISMLMHNTRANELNRSLNRSIARKQVRLKSSLLYWSTCALNRRVDKAVWDEITIMLVKIKPYFSKESAHIFITTSSILYWVRSDKSRRSWAFLAFQPPKLSKLQHKAAKNRVKATEYPVQLLQRGFHHVI